MITNIRRLLICLYITMGDNIVCDNYVTSIITLFHLFVHFFTSSFTHMALFTVHIHTYPF